MAHTYREIVYAILDETKTISDDTLLENEHLIYIANKHRALLFNQKYKGKKVEIPFAWYQRLNVNFTYPSIGSNIYKSTKQIPPVLDTTNLWQYTFISTDGANTPNLNFINPQRFKTCGYNKWTSNELYGTIDLDNYMYLKSKNNKYINISQKSITATIDNGIKYGRLYNWYAATDSRRIAPVGWHVPTQSDWQTLIDFCGGTTIAGIKLKSTDYLGGTDDFNFSAKGLSYYVGNDVIGVIYMQSDYNLITPDPYGDYYSIGVTIAQDHGDSLQFPGSYRYPEDAKKFLESIRLIKDNSINDGDIVIDGDTYHSVTIGTQVWLQQNLAVTHYQNGDLIGSDFSGTEGAVSAYDNDEANVYDIVTATQVYPVINGDILYDTILDNPIDADRFNDTNTLDVLDLEFPCEESLIQPIIDLCLKEIGVINNITRDTTNNASDDASLPKQQ